MRTVRQLLQTKGHVVWTCGPDTSVFEAIRIMADRSIGAVVVTEGDALVGIMSERDYARKVILQGRSSHETTVGQIMTSRVVCASPGDSVEACMETMSDHRIRHLPVLDDGHLVGIVSIGDMIKAIIAEQQFVIAQLERYVTQ